MKKVNKLRIVLVFKKLLQEWH